MAPGARCPVRHRSVLELDQARRPIAVGLNCALGAPEMRPHSPRSRIADTFVSCYPNAGLPNAFGEYDETPEEQARRSPNSPGRPGQHRRRLLRNDPAHIAEIAEVVEGKPPRSPKPERAADPALRPRAAQHHRRHPVRQHRRAHQHHRLRPVPQPDQGRGLRHRALGGPQQVEVGAQIIDVNMDEGMIDGVAAMTGSPS